MDLRPGRPVRVTAPRNDLYRNRASFVAFDGDSLEFRLIHRHRYSDQRPNDSTTESVALSDLQELQVWVGRGPNIGGGFLAGILVGSLLGVPAAGLNCIWEGASCRLTTIGLFGLLGATVGAVIGNSIQHDRWGSVPRSAIVRQAALSMEPMTGGVGIGVRIGF